MLRLLCFMTKIDRKINQKGVRKRKEKYLTHIDS